MKFIVFPRLTLRGRRWYFQARARNGRIILASEGYHNKADALETVQAIKNEAAVAYVEVR